MTKNHDKGRRVAEPVQVYLDAVDRGRLERLTEQLDATKSDVLRRALEALEQQLMDPSAHPALRIIGLGAGYPVMSSPGYDMAREHDRFLAESEEASWSEGVQKAGGGKGPSRGRRKRG
jgi:hypothetical protein